MCIRLYGLAFLFIAFSWPLVLRAEDPSSSQPQPLIEAQAERLSHFVRDTLTKHWPKWTLQEVQEYSRGVREVLRQELTIPLSEEYLRAFERSFERYASALRHDPEGDRFATRVSTVTMMIEQMKWQVQEFARRKPFPPEAAEELQRQIQGIMELAEKEAKVQFAELPEALIQEQVRLFQHSLREAILDVLDMNLKRPLTSDELATIKEALPGEFQRAFQRVQTRENFYRSSTPDPAAARQRALQELLSQALAGISGLLRKPGQPPPPESYLKAAEQIRKEHEELSEAWHREQEEKARQNFVRGMVGWTPEQMEQTLFLFELMFLLRHCLLPEDTVGLY